jgi:hypothetical protein
MRIVPVALALALIGSVDGCIDDSKGSPPAAVDGGVYEGGQGDAGPLEGFHYTVDCSHPGAGAKLADGGCDCPHSLVNFTGVWNGFYTCREGTTCVDKDKAETFSFTQTGNQIHADDADDGGPAGFVFDGIVCGNTFTWSGGPTDGEYVECGILQFSDGNHYVKDSCYVYAGKGTCTPPDVAGGCAANQSGQCTNTGARSPAAASAITKTLCQ